MKKILPLLLVYVLLTTQSYAIKGGPVFSNSNVTVTGNYSGVIQGVTETAPSEQGPTIPGDPVPPTQADATPSNAIGLFDLTVPSTGLATGTFMLFADGTIFSGTINASADPDSGEIKGLLEGDFTFTINTTDAAGAVATTTVNATAVGRLDAQVSSINSFFAVSLARLIGTANLDISFGTIDVNTSQPIINRSITFDVSGFKQADIAVTTGV